MKHRLLSLILALILIVGLAPGIAVHAEENIPAPIVEGACCHGLREDAIGLFTTRPSFGGNLIDITPQRVEDTFNYLDEMYVENHPEAALVINTGTANDRVVLKTLAEKITDGCKNDTEKANAIDEWLRRNIEYDVNTSAYASDTFYTRMGNCLSYANLMQFLLRSLGIPAVVGDGWRGNMAECTVDLFNHEGHAWCFVRLNDEWVLYDPLWLAGGTVDRDYMAKWIYFDTVENVTPASDDDNLPPEAYDKPKIYYTDGKIYAWSEYYGDEIGVLTSFVNNQAFAFVAYQSDPETGASDGWMYVGSDYDKHQMERGQIYSNSWIAYGDYSTNSAMSIAYAHANGMCIDGGVMTLEGQDYLLDKNESFPILADPDDYTITNGRFTLKSDYKGLFLGMPWQDGATEGYIVEWENRNPEIATVDSNGIITCHEEGYAEFYVYLKRQEQNGEMTYMGTSIIPVIISDEERIPVYEDPEEAEVVRTFGATRYDTAFKAADQLKENLGIEKFQNIVVAYGEDFADALSGSYLANQKNAPILLVKNRNKEINAVKDYIRANLTPGGTVYLLGGVNAVPKAMVSGLEGFNVKRLAGATRYETNLEILKEAGISGNDILVCTGLDFADGLSASAVNKPILLVKDGLRATQVNYLKTLGSKNFYLIGGTNAVNKRIESALTAYGTTQRIEGATRYYTSVNIAKTFFPNAKTAVLAYAQNFPDGLAGGCLACSMDAPLILTANGKQAPAVAYAKEAGITGGAVLGGTGLIPDKVANAIFQIS